VGVSDNGALLEEPWGVGVWSEYLFDYAVCPIGATQPGLWAVPQCVPRQYRRMGGVSYPIKRTRLIRKEASELG
jgi:hypothetical protein